MSHRLRLKTDIINTFKEENLNIDSIEDSEDGTVTAIRIPISLNSVPSATVSVFIDDFKCQLFNFNVATNINMDINILETINKLNSDYAFGKFYIEENKVTYQDTHITENVSAEDFIELLRLLIKINDDAFDEIMKAKYK